MTIEKRFFSEKMDVYQVLDDKRNVVFSAVFSIYSDVDREHAYKDCENFIKTEGRKT